MALSSAPLNRTQEAWGAVGVPECTLSSGLGVGRPAKSQSSADGLTHEEARGCPGRTWE